MKAAGKKMDERLDQGLDKFSRWLDSPSSLSDIVRTEKPVDIPWIPNFYEPIDPRTAIARAQVRAWSVNSGDDIVPGPERDPKGWVSHRGPDRRQYWHHRSLGPAPWEVDPKGFAAGCKQPEPSADRPLPSPEEAPQGWASHQRADGRVFWHNLALGPPPWEDAQEEGAAAVGLAEEDAVAEEGSLQGGVAVAHRPVASGLLRHFGPSGSPTEKPEGDGLCREI